MARGTSSAEPRGLRAMTPLVLLTLCVSVTEAGGLYRLYQGYDLQPCPMTSMQGTYTKSRCVSKCSQTVGCVAGTFQEDSGQCCLSDRYIYTTGLCGVSRANSVYFQQEKDHASTDDQWLLAFRAASGNGQSVYHAWYNTGTYHDFPVGGASSTPITCWSTSASCSCSHHLRSKLLDLWREGSVSPQRVKFAVFESGIEVANIVFNGVGSNVTSWFDPARINSSTFTGVTTTQTYNYFSVDGLFRDNVMYRPFYVSHSHPGCPLDCGWMMVVERPLCAWEMLGYVPLFLYSTRGGCSVWHTSGRGIADVTAVFLQL